MQENREINPRTNSLLEEIKKLPTQSKGMMDFMEKLRKDENVKAIHVGTEKELQEIKNKECNHIRVKREGKWVCAKCDKNYEGEKDAT